MIEEGVCSSVNVFCSLALENGDRRRAIMLFMRLLQPRFAI